MNEGGPFDLVSLVVQIDEALRWPRSEESLQRARRLAHWIFLSSPSSEIADLAALVVDAASAVDVHAEYSARSEAKVRNTLSALEEAVLDTKAVSAR